MKGYEQRRSELFAKQGRVQQFSTTAERDRWINKEITSLQQSAAQKEQQVHTLIPYSCNIVYLDTSTSTRCYPIEDQSTTPVS